MAVPNDKRDYVRASLGLATAQICQSLGWHSVQRSSHDVLTDVLERYINLVSKRAALISQTCSRTAPNLDDVVLAFKQLGIHIHELQDYMQQVEASPAIKPIPKVPIPKEPCLLDFSGEDFLPALIDVSIKEEDEVEEEKADGEDEGNPNASLEKDGESKHSEHPKNLSFNTDSLESPPYSPLEPKNLNLNAVQNLDLTRPDLKVITPKGYTPTLTTRPVLTGVASVVNTVAQTPSPGDRKSVLVTHTKAQSKSETKANKKEKKSSKKTDSPGSLLSPPSVKSGSPSPKISKKISSPSIKSKEKDLAKEQREKEKREKREKEKRERELKREKEIEREKEAAAAREEEAAAREQERQRELELEKLKVANEKDEEKKPLKVEDVFDDFEDDVDASVPSPHHAYLLHAPQPDSPTSSLFTLPRVRIASYQSDKKKKSSKEKDGKKHKKDSTDSKQRDDKKSSKHKTKKSPALSSPSSYIKSPLSVRADILSPPKLSQPIIKHERSSNKTVIFPPDSSPDRSSSKTSPSPRLAYPEQRTVSPAIIKTKFSPFDDDNDIIDEDEIKTEEEHYEKVSPLKVSTISSSHNNVKSEGQQATRHPTDISENEIDVTSLSQGEEAPTNYTESFQPDMFFPTKFKEEKKKKKKKKSEKDRDEKLKKREDKKEKKDRKRKLEESPLPSTSTSTSTSIPKLTLKMGTEKMNDVKQPPAKISKKHTESPFAQSTLTPSASQLIKKKKDKKQKQKQKEKEREREEVPPPSASSNTGIYVETTNTAKNYGSEVYYCPGCGLADDGSPMIGCDTCDGWYHWPCVNIKEEPAEDEQWFCPKCQGGGSKKKKKKKKREP